MNNMMNHVHVSQRLKSPYSFDLKNTLNTVHVKYYDKKNLSIRSYNNGKI